VRWWRFVLGGALLAWLLGTAYTQARRRDRQLGLAVLLLGAGVTMFTAAAVVPRPPMTAAAASLLIVGSVALLAAAIGVVLLRGFRD
jgi:ABC-type uncharacterized transport system permease subunit